VIWLGQGVECVSTIAPKTTRRRPNSRVGEKKHISDDPQIVVNFANRLSNWSRFRHIGDGFRVYGRRIPGGTERFEGSKISSRSRCTTAFRLQVQLSVRCGLSYVRWRNIYPTTLGSIILKIIQLARVPMSGIAH
jgi:hypothetical protein